MTMIKQVHMTMVKHVHMTTVKQNAEYISGLGMSYPTAVGIHFEPLHGEVQFATSA